MEDIEFLFLTHPHEMLEALKESKEKGSVIGICSTMLGGGIFLTSVENIFLENDIFEGGEIIIVLKRYDMHGYFLEKNTITLADIRSVCPLKAEFKNPFMRIAVR